MAPQFGYAGVLTRQRKRPSTRQHERRNLRVRGLKARDRRTRNSLYFSIRALVIANSLRTRFGSVMCAHVRAGLGHAVGDQVCGGLRAARSICQRRRLGLDDLDRRSGIFHWLDLCHCGDAGIKHYDGIRNAFRSVRHHDRHRSWFHRRALDAVVPLHQGGDSYIHKSWRLENRGFSTHSTLKFYHGSDAALGGVDKVRLLVNTGNVASGGFCTVRAISMGEF